MLAGAYAALGLVLVAVGLYGVVSYVAEQRTREIGVRRALGAPTAHVVRRARQYGLAVLAGAVALGVGVAAAADVPPDLRRNPSPAARVCSR